MAENLQNQLKEVGSKLENPPASKDDLIKLLTQATESLSELDQSPPKALLDSMQPLLKAIVKPELLKHEDKEVSLLVAICTCEITRITAPEAPYDDDVLKDIFRLFVSTFSGLGDTKDPSFEKRVMVLDTVSKYRSFVVMLDLECDDLVNEMFKTFFTVASEEHHKTVITAMEIIMVVLLEESEEIGDDLLFIILSVLGRDKKDITSAARNLAMNVIKQSASILEPGIKKFLVSSMSEDNTSSNPQIDYHEVIYDIYRCAPQTLSKIVPNLKKELLTDEIDVRLKAVKFVGGLFCIKGSTIPQTFHPIFLEFLKKFTDKVVEVRMSVVEHAKLCLLSDPSRTEAPQLVAALSDRLSDDDESIRKQVVEVISNVASMDLSSISSETIKLLAERLEDKSVVVKKYTLERLSDIYRTWCLKKIGNLDMNHDYDWIPGRILKCSFDKDIGLDTVEKILSTSLFPVEILVKDKVKNWVKLISKFDKVEVNALEKILEERQRLQLELQKYLSLRETYKESDASEVQKKTALCVRFMSHCFVDPIKAEADFQILDELKDDNIWKILKALVDPTTSSLQSRSLRDELLKIVGEKHPLYELLNTLSIKCSYLIFDKDFVKGLILEIDQQKSDGNKLLTQSCMNILVTIASFSHLLLSGIEEHLVHLLEDYDDEAIKDGVLCVLSKAGETIRGQLGESSSTLDLILERICLEGSRSQAKYAVHALSAITKDDGLKSLSVLYKRLVDVLEEKTNLPSVLQSLGCIAQIAMPVFETQESKIEEFIRKNILSCSHKPGNKAKKSWDNKSEVCSLKIYGIKALVKSYLPVKDAHLRVGIDELLKDLHNILSFGEISKDVESSSVDKAHLKLASAKAIIRLSKHWDKKIPVDLFHLTLRTSEGGFPQVRKLFVKKVHQYIKNRSLDFKYVCAFLLDFRSRKPILEEESQNLSEILETSEQGNSSVYILPYLVHALAHHPSCPNIDECKDVRAYEPIFRKLYIYFSKLAPGDVDGKPGVCLKREDIISIISVLRTIKFSKDAVDTNMSKNSYAICDLCLIITKRLAQKFEDVYESVVPVSLPDVLYTQHKKKQEEKEHENKEDEIEEVNKEDEKKENEKIEADSKDEKKEEDINKEDKKEDEKIEEVNKNEKIEEVNKEDKKEDEKMEEDNKDEKIEDKKLEEDSKNEKVEEETNKEDKNKEDEKMEEDNKDEKKEGEKIEEDSKDDNKEEINKEDMKIEDDKMEEDNKEEEIIKDNEKKEDEKKEEDNTEVKEGRTWLADENVLAHFESLIFEANGDISSKTNEAADVTKDSETDGNEIPLGKIIKRLKAKGSKARKEVKNGPTPTPTTTETANNVDIMGMLREINLDNLGGGVVSTKFDSTNGHKEKEIIKSEEESNLKRKGVPDDHLTNVPVPKRRRSTSSAKGHKRSSFITSGPAFNNKMDHDGHSDSEEDKVSLDRGLVVHKDEGKVTDEVDLEKAKKSVESGSNQKSVNLRKRKRRRVSRLVKCTRDETDFKTKDLIGRRIKVWWPMDKVFYEGLVKSYDRENNKHVVLYDDGDIEVLCLDKERWKVVGSGHKLAERKLMSYSPPPKEGTSKRNKSSDRSKRTKVSTDISPSSMVRGKRTPRQNLKQGQKGVSQRSAYLEIKSKNDDVIMPEPNPTISSKTDKLDAGEKGEENSDKLEKSRSKEEQTKDAESSSNDSMSSSHKNEPEKETENDETAPGDKSGSDEKEKQSVDDEAHKSDSEEESGEESESTDVQQTPDGKESSTSDDDDADMAELEFTDDEPLGVWKSRVGKSVEGK